jgi:hypothetical protein
MILFVTSSSTILVVGLLLGFYNANLPINMEDITWNYIFILIEALLTFFIIYTFPSAFKKISVHF